MNYADMVILNGIILTMDSLNSIAEAIAINNGIITYVGNKHGIKEYISSKTKVIDLNGKTLVPGFIDSHVHLVQTGLNTLAVDLSEASSISQCLCLLKKGLEKSPKNTIICGKGLEEIKIKERRFPTRYELDSVVNDRPCVVSTIEWHVLSVNSYALHYLNLPFNSAGMIKNASGLPTGLLYPRASYMARKKLFELMHGMVYKGVVNAVNNALSHGVTTIGAMEGGFIFHDNHVDFLLDFKDSMPIDIEIFYQTTNTEKVISKGLKRMGGCIFLDGAFGTRTAALLEPYWDDKQNYGELYFSQEEVDNIISSAHEKGLQISFHAIGDRAIEQVLTSYEKVLKSSSRNHRHRIEHFELPTEDQIVRAAKLGLIMSMQPAYEHYWGGEGRMYDVRLGPHRRKKTNPYKTLIQKGVLIIGGSDSDVTPINPLLGIHSAVNHPTPEERISPLEALKMFTINGAIGLSQEHIKGSIENNKNADLVILSENPIEVPEHIKDILIEYTIKEGNILYSKEK